MSFLEIQKIFNRALYHTFSKSKWLFTSLILVACGLFVVFCRGLATHAGSWTSISLIFIPIFICTSLLLGLGCILTRLYHDEVKNQVRSFSKVFSRSWDILLGSAYLTFPLLLIFLLLWILLGLFFLLREVPTVGPYFSVFLSFGPFLLLVGCFILAFLSLVLLFFATPALSLQQSKKVIPSIILRLQKNFLSNLILLIFSIIPALFFILLLVLAAILTEVSYLPSETNLQIVLQWFFIMIPFALLLSPAVIFFFNFAAESHVLLKR